MKTNDNSVLNDALLVYCTCPTEDVAEHLATALVETKLAACVNMAGPVRSVYRWQGQIERETEILLMIKTTTAAWPALQKNIIELHPYDVPEIIAVPIVMGNKDYLMWVGESICAN